MKIEAPMVPGPWVVNETTTIDGQLQCDFTRVEHHFYWTIGQYPSDCTDCAQGSPDNTIPFDVEILITEYWLDQPHCNDQPVGY